MKKITLRIICLALSAALCLCVSGCAPADERAFERACDLMDAGEYEAAIEAFSAIGMYEQISEKIDEAQELLDEENSEFLYGDWVDLQTGSVFTFSKGGKGNVAAQGEAIPFSYTCDGKTVEITEPLSLWLKVSKEDDILHLKDPDGLYDLVTQKDYVNFGPVTIEITPDNWQEYFEGKQAQDVGVDSEGHVDHRELLYGIFLKEEYLSRLDYDACDGQVWFEIEYSYAPYLLEGDLQSDTYTLTEVRMPKELDMYRGKFYATEPVNYRGYQIWRSPESDINNAVCCLLGVEILEHDGQTYVMMIDNAKVVNAWGQLHLEA